MKVNTIFLAVLIIFLHLLIFANSQFIDWPEMLLYPWLTSQGLNLYSQILIPYQPLLIFCLNFLLSILGFLPSSLQIIHFILFIITDILLITVSYQVTKSIKSALTSLLVFVVWQPTLEGNGLWFDHFTLPFLLIAFLFLWFHLKHRTLINGVVAGISLGTVLILKQTMYWVILVLIILSVLKAKFRFKSLLMPLVISLFLPLGQLGLFALSNRLTTFVYWVYEFGFGLRNNPDYLIFPNLKGDYPLILFVITVLILSCKIFIKKKTPLLFFTFIWTLFSFVPMFPRWTLTHAQTGILFTSILLGVIIQNFRFNRQLFNTMILAVLVIITVKNLVVYLKNNPQEHFRFYTKETKNNLQVISKYRENNNFYLLGNIEFYYVYLQQKPQVLPYVQMFPWNFELENVQESQIEQLKNKKIDQILISSYHSNQKFYFNKYPEKLFLYLNKNYTAPIVIGENLNLLKRKTE